MEKKRIESLAAEFDKKRINKFNLGYDGVTELLPVLYVLCRKNFLLNLARLSVSSKISEVPADKSFPLSIVIILFLSDTSCRALSIFIKRLQFKGAKSRYFR